MDHCQRISGSGFRLTDHGILPATGLELQGAKDRCDNKDKLSAWAAAQAVVDEVEVPCRKVGL